MKRKAKAKADPVVDDGGGTLEIVMRDLDAVELDPENLKEHPDEQIEGIARSLRTFGQRKPIVVDAGGKVLAGNGTVEAARRLGWTRIATVVSSLDELGNLSYAIADNRTAEGARWKDELSAALVRIRDSGRELFATGFSSVDLDQMLGGTFEPPAAGPTLVERFGCPPFTLLDARQGYWRTRRAAWLSLGIESEAGRSDVLAGRGARGYGLVGVPKRVRDGYSGPLPGTSVFDPVLVELAVSWLSPLGGSVLDPFAGGSVRGVVSAVLGRSYRGIDLSARQVKENRRQWRAIASKRDPAAPPPGVPTWTVGDARKALADVPSESVDLVFTCPPYGDLERYSDDPNDLSTMAREAFLVALGDVVRQAVAKLRPDRFAAIVVGDYRDAKGMLTDFPGSTVRAFEAAGARFYNDAVFVPPMASLALRAGRAFAATRKLGRAHQVLLMFVKGDPAKASKACGDVVVDYSGGGFGLTADGRAVEDG